MRRPVKNRNKRAPDPEHNSLLVEQVVNYVMLNGKKNTARTIVYGALEDAKTLLKVDNVVDLLETAVRNVGPTIEVRSRRVGGANYQVPREVRPERKDSLAIRWILAAAKGRSGVPMRKRLSEELQLAYKGEGEAVKKRENVHKMAEANRAFAHFAW